MCTFMCACSCHLWCSPLVLLFCLGFPFLFSSFYKFLTAIPFCFHFDEGRGQDVPWGSALCVVFKYGVLGGLSVTFNFTVEGTKRVQLWVGQPAFLSHPPTIFSRPMESPTLPPVSFTLYSFKDAL